MLILVSVVPDDLLQVVSPRIERAAWSLLVVPLLPFLRLALALDPG